MNNTTDKFNQILVICGQYYLRERSELQALINKAMQEHPEWGSVETFNWANRVISAKEQRDSLQVSPNVVVMNPTLSGRTTPDPHGSPGVISRSRATNAIAIQQGVGAGQFARLDATPGS